MLTKPTRRRGFTLIEILVVIALIAVLAALSVGALFRVRAAQQTNNTEATLAKIDTLMMARWSAVLSQAKSTLPQAVIDYCDGDKDRGLALWTYAVLRNEFPEKKSDLTTYTVAGVSFQSRKVFDKVKNDTTSTTDEQSAALIYAAIMETGNRGTVNSLEGLQQQSGPTDSGLTIFKDNWGMPIVFYRHASNSETAVAPYSKPSVSGSNNPLDPRKLLIGWSNATNRKAAAQVLLGQDDFPNTNNVPTLISAGPDKLFGAYMGNPSVATDAGNDNLLSYRRREGERKN